MGKLVRDKIPDIIKESGGEPEFWQLNSIDYRNALYDKLKEEVEELCKDRNAEEMADVIEVLTCLCIDDPTTYGNVFEIAKVKKEKRGSFLRRYFLKKYE